MTAAAKADQTGLPRIQRMTATLGPASASTEELAAHRR